MKEIKTRRKENNRERGAALITTLIISLILSIACISLLAGVGANSRNSTDVLSETKAYYAAESGLQATINVLRGNTVLPDARRIDATKPATDEVNKITYIKAVDPITSNITGEEDIDPRLSRWITYNYPTSGTPDRVVVGQSPNAYTPNSGSAYSISVTDPDNTGDSLTFNTSGTFLSYGVVNGATFSADKKTIYIPNNTAAVRTEITFIDAASTTHNFEGTPSNPSLGRFTITKVGGGVDISEVKFQIDYRLTAPRTSTLSIKGSINKAPLPTSTNPKDGIVTFDTDEYKLMGSKIELCSTATSPQTGENRCPTVKSNLTSAAPSPTFLYADITALEPYRLLVKSTGYGPNGAKKQLEAIIQRNFFNGVGPGAATTMLGTNTTPPGGLPFLFVPGTSSGISYSGGDCASVNGCVPSFGLTNPANFNYVLTHPPGPGAGNPNQMLPPPAQLGNVPDWQQTPQTLDALVDKLRTTAQNSGRYFKNPTGNADNFTVGNNQNPPGSLTEGTGITFCEGSCRLGASGGGILVVTGKLTNVGDFSFKGMIIVTGEEGWERNGAGQGQVIGNVIISPYNKRTYIPENLSSTFLAPRYAVTGGGGSDVIYDNISGTLDNTSQVSDFMLGVAEK